MQSDWKDYAFLVSLRVNLLSFSFRALSAFSDGCYQGKSVIIITIAPLANLKTLANLCRCGVSCWRALI